MDRQAITARAFALLLSLLSAGAYAATSQATSQNGADYRPRLQLIADGPFWIGRPPDDQAVSAAMHLTAIPDEDQLGLSEELIAYHEATFFGFQHQAYPRVANVFLALVVARRMADLGEPNIPALIGVLKDPRRIGGHFVAIRALRWIGKPAVEPLIQLLPDPDLRVRERAALALSGIDDPRAFAPLIGALEKAPKSWPLAFALGGVKSDEGSKAALGFPATERRWSLSKDLSE